MASVSWVTGGNAATNPPTDFLGTTDAKPLVIKTNNAEALRVDVAGHIGVGTITPVSDLHLAPGKVLRIDGASSANPQETCFSFGGNGTFAIDAPNVASGRFVVNNSGKVGIANPTPTSDLHLAGGKVLRIEGGSSATDTTTCFSFGGNGTFAIDAPNIPAGRFVVENSGKVGIGAPSPSFDLHLAAGKVLRVEGGSTATDTTTCFSFGGFGTFAIDAPGVSSGRFVVNNAGKVGIANPNPTSDLHLAGGKVLRIEGGTGATDTTTCFSFGGNGTFAIDAPNVPAGRFVVDNLGQVGIGTPAPHAKLHVAGDLAVSGKIFLNCADCAEQFDVHGALPEPGTVVVIGDEGSLRESRDAYDRKVAGVVSGAGSYQPALVMDRRESDESRVSVALVGKVFCKVDAQYSAIGVGDLLTTSPTPGHAMRAAEPSKAFGSTIGKALKALESGQGLIPILICLQ